MSSLARYIEKRDFTRTPEPVDGGRASSLAPRYAIQKHAARRTHFDLRLEWNGVLLSWAVTRGPSFSPAEKRLAVRTEDHPLSYIEFEGEIPKGAYGAGTVMLWDIGHWEPLDPVENSLAKGHLPIRLHGVRLTGDWQLVRMRGAEKRENWLLVKADDEAAGARDPVRRYRRSVTTHRTFREITAGNRPGQFHEGKRPRFRKPQLATVSTGTMAGDDWWHEVKFDGYRALIALGDGGPQIFTRNGKNWTDRFASLCPAFAAIDCQSALIDGEIVAGAGLAGFSALQKAVKSDGPFRFYAFDLLECNGSDMTGRALENRRDALERIWRLMPELGPVQLSPVIAEDPEAALRTICNASGEGLIAKRRDAPYRGRRTTTWRKVKCRNRDAFVILGWQSSDKRGRPFASLALGVSDNGQWTYIGKVGTGFGSEQLEELASVMRPLSGGAAPDNVTAEEARGVQWIAPELVAEISYSELTSDRRLRHATFEELRDDKPSRIVRLGGDAMPEEERIPVAGIPISHPDRVIFPDAKITKLDVARFYEEMSDRILTTVRDRPLSLVRLPDGLTGERFFQKHAGKGFPDSLKTVDIRESDGEEKPYMQVDNAAGLVGAAQMGTIEFHIWGSRIDRLERPDRMIFDLDPGEGVGFAAVKSAAAEVRDLLSELDLPAWPLLTGGKGVHVVVPLRRTAGWDTVKLFSRVFAMLMSRRSPDRYVSTMSKAKRKGRIFIDWFRNERGATAIAPFSLRARTGAPVAIPVSWEELNTLKLAATFDLHSARDRDWSTLHIPSPAGLTAGRVERLDELLART